MTTLGEARERYRNMRQAIDLLIKLGRFSQTDPLITKAGLLGRTEVAVPLTCPACQNTLMVRARVDHDAPRARASAGRAGS